MPGRSQTFTTPVNISGAAPGGLPLIAVDSKDNIDVAWETGKGIFFTHSTDGGKTFAAAVALSTGEGNGALQMNADGNGNIYLLWQGTDMHFRLSRSADGVSFSAPILVSASHSTPASGGAFGANGKSMAVDGSGNINVVWQDDILTPGSPDIFFSRSTDAGASFSAAQNVSRSPGAGSPQMAVDSGGNVDVVWAANDAGQVFFSRGLVSQPADGFTISVTPASLMVLPGGTATAQVALTATGAFNQVVTLSCGNLPPSVQCSFTPPTVTPSKSGALGTVTVSVAPTLSTGGFPFTVNAFSPTISQFQSMQITVGVLTGSVTPTAATIPLGGSALFSVTVASTTGFGGQFGLACTAPAGVTCTFSPASAFLPINGRSFSALKVQVLSTPATGSAPKNPRDTFPLGLPQGKIVVPIFVLLLLLAGAMALAILRRKEGGGFVPARTMASIFVSAGLTVALGAILLSCAGTTATNRNKATLGSGAGAASTGGTSGIMGTGGVGGTGGSAGAGGTTTGGVNSPGSTSITFPLTVQVEAGASIVTVGTISVTVP